MAEKKNTKVKENKTETIHDHMYVGGINAHVCVGACKVLEGGDSINLVAVGCTLMRRKLFLLDEK